MVEERIEIMEEKYCPICEKHCSMENIGCKRGKKYFYLEQDHEGNQETKLIALFYKCTHIFMHRNGNSRGKNRILAILHEHGDMTQRELLDHTDIREASLSELLSKIEANGGIKRERSSQDARQVNIELTETGKIEAEQIRQEQAEFAKELFSALNAEEMKQLECLLVKLLLSWKAERKEKH